MGLKRPPTSGTRYGNGAGHGGHAKGAASSRGDPHPPFEPSNTAAITDRPRDYSRTAKREALKEHLLHLATTAERQSDQIAAAREWLNRDEGMPVARNLTVTSDDLAALDDAALEQRQAELEAALRGDVGGAASPADPQGPDSLVH